MGNLALEVDSVTLFRGGQAILKELSLSVPKGKPFALVGESGSGKTSLLLGILGLLPVQSGKIRVNGEEVSDLAPRELAERVGLVFQDYQLFPHLSVLDNLLLAPNLLAKEGTEEKAQSLLEELHIGALGGRFPHELSGGQKQRVAIARALMLDPGLLFFDEPSSALDIQTSRELSQTLGKLGERAQVIVVSHDRDFVTDCCPEGALLASGQVARSGPVGTLMG